MRFYTNQHEHYCGIDLHARSMWICILDSAGEVRVDKNVVAGPDEFLKIIKPYRSDVAVAVECIFTWYWLADLCTQEDIRFVLGHALYMKAIHGGKAKNDRIDAYKIAVLLRGGMLPQAYVYPEKMRATRDLLRRRLYLVRIRGELLTHIQNTNHQYNLGPIHSKLNYPSNRDGFVDRFTDSSVRKSMETDLELIGHLERTIRSIEVHVLKQSRQHDPEAVHLLRSIPGIGKILANSLARAEPSITIPFPKTSCAWTIVPSSPGTTRCFSNPNASQSHAMAAAASLYRMVGITVAAVVFALSANGSLLCGASVQCCRLTMKLSCRTR